MTVAEDTGVNVVCRERFGSSVQSRKYVRSSVTSRSVHLTTISEGADTPQSLISFFTSVFLPQGYPESVSCDYLTYQMWDTLQAFCSSITGYLATHAVLKGSGVGDETASILAATITWLLKDGAGMIGHLVFAWAKGSQLDADCKRWRLFADIINDVSIFLNLMAPLYQPLFRLMSCTAGFLRSIVGVAGGATRAALTQHQARRNNMADVSAKDGSQETLVNLSALLCSLLLVPAISDDQNQVWALFLTSTALHLYSNYRAVTCLQVETFNQTRLHLAVQGYLRSGCERVASVAEVNAREPVLWPLRRPLKLYLGASACHITKDYSTFTLLTHQYHRCGYILDLDLTSASCYIILREGSGVEEQLRACFQASLLSSLLPPSPLITTTNTQWKASDQYLDEMRSIMDKPYRLGGDDICQLLSLSLKFTSHHFQPFLRLAREAGWQLEYALLSSDEWRAVWGEADKTS